MIEPSVQQEAVFKWFREGQGNLVVRARAGTGKSWTAKNGVLQAPEERILIAAFNKLVWVS